MPAERLEQVAKWAAAAVQAAQAFYDDHAQPFKGGLAVFVMKDRFSYEEFCQTVERREPQAAIHGHAVVTPDLKDAYVVVQDGADTGGSTSTRAELLEQIGAAFLMRFDPKLPEWLIVGSGRMLARPNGASAIPTSQWPQVYRLVGSLEKPEDLLTDGTFRRRPRGKWERQSSRRFWKVTTRANLSGSSRRSSTAQPSRRPCATFMAPICARG